MSNTILDRFAACYKTTYHQAVDAFESGRSKVVDAARRTFPAGYANIIERISRAVPEVLCAMCSFTGILTAPACIVSLGRKCVPILPLVKTLLRGELNKEALGRAGEETIANLRAMFEDVIVPALLVYFVADAALAFGTGWATLNCAKLLYASAVAVPAAWLVFSHMWNTTPASVT